MKRRATNLAAVYLMLGLVTTVGVAWASVFDPFRDGPTARSLDRRAWLFKPPTDWPVDPDRAVRRRSLLWTSFLVSYESFIFSEEPSFTQTAMRYGLPLRAMERRNAFTSVAGPINYEATNFAQSDGGSRIRAGLQRLPLRPIWPGLAFNTLFYALLWWLAFASVRMVKHNRRYRRGLCPLCRYDLLADYSKGCSECGWGRDLRG